MTSYFRVDNRKDIRERVRHCVHYTEVVKKPNGIWWAICNGKIVCLITEYDAPNKSLSVKDVSESEYPHHYSCPQRFLDSVPEVNRLWRERVALWQTKKRELRIRIQVSVPFDSKGKEQ